MPTLKQPQLKLKTWKFVEGYLQGSRAVLVPIGATEQHGPNGIIGTDTVCAEEVAIRAGAKAGVLVAPTINVGMSLHHMAFPGSMSLQPETLIAVIRDYVSSLYAHGFRGFLFVNGHGGNIASGQAAFSGISEVHRDARLEWYNWWDCEALGKLSTKLFGDREGAHATPTEVALTMAVYPDDVKGVKGPLNIKNCRFHGIPGSREFRKLYPDGRIASDPSMSTPENGAQVLEVAVVGAIRAVRALAKRVAPKKRR